MGRTMSLSWNQRHLQNPGQGAPQKVRAQNSDGLAIIIIIVIAAPLQEC